MTELSVPNAEPVIEIRGVTKRFGAKTVLSNITLTIYRGETFVIMGGSGCGKSTLLRTIIGALPPEEGEVRLFGQTLARLSPEAQEALKKRLGMVFQNGALFDSMSVGDNIRLPLIEHSKLERNIIDIVMRLKLELVGLRGVEHLMPSQISGGMRKRVSLARAIALDPELVFYDEPTAGLDPVMTAVIDKLIVDLSRKLEITSIVVTHDMQSVFRIAHRVAMLHQGEVVALGTPEAIRQSSDPIVRQFVNGDPDGPIAFVQTGGDSLDRLVADSSPS